MHLLLSAIVVRRDCIDEAAPVGHTTDLLAAALFSKFVLPFEIAAVLLLAAMIGALVLAKDEP